MGNNNSEISDFLSLDELTRRDQLIVEGLASCKAEIGKQKSRDMYFCYEGSLDGFELCSSLCSFGDFEAKRNEFYMLETKEIACSSLRSQDEDIQLLRESLGIAPGEKTDSDKVWQLKGIWTQMDYVYNRLLCYRAVRDMMDEKENELGDASNDVNVPCCYNL